MLGHVAEWHTGRVLGLDTSACLRRTKYKKTTAMAITKHCTLMLIHPMNEDKNSYEVSAPLMEQEIKLHTTFKWWKLLARYRVC